MLTPYTPLRIGILGAANIARLFTRDVRGSADVEVVAVASRTEVTAARFAAETGIARHHASYEALLADPTVDIIYIPLPNSLHAPWAMAAAAAGKHVLCEKPLTLSAAEARAMFEAARRHGVMLLEAYPYWFQPQTGAMLELLREGAIGQPRFVQASFGFTVPNPASNIRLDPALGGGALLDAGSYPLSLIRLVMGDAPQRVSAEADWADSGVDIAMLGSLQWADGRRAQMACSMAQGVNRQATIVGSAGTLTTEFLNHAHDGECAGSGAGEGENPFGFLPSLMRLRRGVPGTVPFKTIHSPGGSGFRFAAEAFARVIREQDHAAIERAASASIDIAAMLEALALSARLGRAVGLEELGAA